MLKSNKLRMRELDIEEKAMLSRGAEGRLAAVEQRLENLERSLGAPQPSSLGQRAAMLEGPASANPTSPELPRLKQRP